MFASLGIRLKVFTRFLNRHLSDVLCHPDKPTAIHASAEHSEALRPCCGLQYRIIGVGKEAV